MSDRRFEGGTGHGFARRTNSSKSQRGRSVSLKVSEKGGLSVYGLGRFPVTLYKEQWTKLLAMADEIQVIHQGARRGAEDERRLTAAATAGSESRT